jgi:hypothetical protein
LLIRHRIRCPSNPVRRSTLERPKVLSRNNAFAVLPEKTEI